MAKPEDESGWAGGVGAEAKVCCAYLLVRDLVLLCLITGWHGDVVLLPLPGQLPCSWANEA